MNSIGCLAVRPAVRWAAAEGTGLPGVVAGHVSRCVRCQAESVRIRRTLRLAVDAFPRSEVPPAGLVGAVMGATLETAPSVHRARSISMAAAAATGVAILVVHRRRVSSG